MCIFTDTILDQHGLPVAGATVTIRDDDDELVDLATGNPVISDSRGSWSADLPEGDYTLEIRKGDAVVTREINVCPCTE